MVVIDGLTEPRPAAGAAVHRTLRYRYWPVCCGSAGCTVSITTVIRSDVSTPSASNVRTVVSVLGPFTSRGSLSSAMGHHRVYRAFGCLVMALILLPSAAPA